MSAAFRTFRKLGRDPALVRVVASYELFSITEYSVWIAVLVYAYDQGGATAAGLVAFVELVPAALVAPFVSAAADRHSPARVLMIGYVAQGLGVTALALAYFGDTSPYVFYAAAVVASTAVSSTRPSIAALMPALAREVDSLTAANAVLGWLESVSIALAGLWVGVSLAVGDVGHVFAGSAALLALAAALVASLYVAPMGAGDTESVRDAVRTGVREVRRSPDASVLVGLLGVEFIVLGALDVLFVVLAIAVLGESASWAGYLNTAYGIGGIVLGSLAALLVGRRLGPVVAVTAIGIGVTLSLTAVVDSSYAAALLLAVVGGCRALYDVAIRSLLQRAVPAQMVARIFGLAECAELGGLALGSLLAPALVAIGGSTLAVVGTAVLLPLFVVVGGRSIVDIDRRATVPVVQIALLRSVTLFRDLPAPALEGVARSLRRVDVEPGVALIRQGDVGEDYYAIADGEVEVSIDGRSVRTLGRGSGVGEIALLTETPRTATVTAVTPVTVFALDRASFLTAVSAHVPTQRTAEGIVSQYVA